MEAAAAATSQAAGRRRSDAQASFCCERRVRRGAAVELRRLSGRATSYKLPDQKDVWLDRYSRAPCETKCAFPTETTILTDGCTQTRRMFAVVTTTVSAGKWQLLRLKNCFYRRATQNCARNSGPVPVGTISVGQTVSVSGPQLAGRSAPVGRRLARVQKCLFRAPAPFHCHASYFLSSGGRREKARLGAIVTIKGASDLIMEISHGTI